MFKLDSATSPRLINSLFTELLGPDEAKKFWRKFRENYITYEDIAYIKALGLNSVRVPFNARLFMPDEGENVWMNEGFIYLDSVVAWCKRVDLWVLLDMHCAPGGQTGDNIDDSWGYPFLFEDAALQDHAERCVATFRQPGHWAVVQSYDRARGTSYARVSKHRHDGAVVRAAFDELLESVRFPSCTRNHGYQRALGCREVE
jgi:hypothetical protein